MNIYLRFLLPLIALLTFNIANAAIIFKEKPVDSIEKPYEEVLTRIQLFNMQMKEFDLLDLNNDGLITKEELNHIGFPKEAIEHLFLLLDEDNTSSIKKSEVLYRVSKEFDSIDDNKDGNLTIDELKKYLISVVPVILEENKIYHFEEKINKKDMKKKCYHENHKFCGHDNHHHKNEKCHLINKE